MTKSDKEPLDFVAFEKNAIEELKKGKPLTGKDGVITPLLKRILEASMEGEIEAHLQNPEEIRNRRNGRGKKTVKTGQGQVEIATPKDRNGTFQPILVRKRRNVLNETLDDKILGLFSHGLSYSQIQDHMQEMYGVELSTATLSAITDKIIPVIREWQGRQLDAVYPFVWLDAFFIKIREEGYVRQKCAYSVLGLDIEGKKDVLGVYLNDTEGAKFWLQVLTDLKNRGVKDILIASIDGLKGFPEAIEVTFEKTEVQLCIVHQVRNSLKYVAWKDYKAFVRDLKQVYRAANKDLAEKRLGDLRERWGDKYPIVIKSWENNWDRLSAFYKYPDEVRRVMYTTNTIEGFHRQMRKILKTKGAFPTKEAFLKISYLAIQNIQKKWERPIHNWNQILSTLCTLYGERVPLTIKG